MLTTKILLKKYQVPGMGEEVPVAYVTEVEQFFVPVGCGWLATIVQIKGRWGIKTLFQSRILRI